jgi:hypothetical protein
MPEEIWFLESLHSVAEEMGLDTWADIVKRVTSFLWMDDLFNIQLMRTYHTFVMDMTNGEVTSPS